MKTLRRLLSYGWQTSRMRFNLAIAITLIVALTFGASQTSHARAGLRRTVSLQRIKQLALLDKAAFELVMSSMGISFTGFDKLEEQNIGTADENESHPDDSSDSKNQIAAPDVPAISIEFKQVFNPVSGLRKLIA